jgi:hypothetical protein
MLLGRLDHAEPKWPAYVGGWESGGTSHHALLGPIDVVETTGHRVHAQARPLTGAHARRCGSQWRLAATSGKR